MANFTLCSSEVKTKKEREEWHEKSRCSGSFIAAGPEQSVWR
jgi:hypothetical protein